VTKALKLFARGVGFQSPGELLENRCPKLAEIIRKVRRSGEADYAVLPIENYISGSIMRYTTITTTTFDIVGGFYPPTVSIALLCRSVEMSKNKTWW